MSESDTGSVDCPLCGESFDPTAAGGWCTNSNCGEWQYEGDATPDQQTEPKAPDGSSSAETDDGEGEQTEESGSEVGEADADDDSPADARDEIAPEESTESDDIDADADSATIECPGCGTPLAEDVNFCPDCGEDVSALPADDAETDELTACPSCGADVDEDDNFCVQCGEDLAVHRSEPNFLTECPDCGTDVDEDDSFCAGCGADLGAHRSGTVDAGATEPESRDSNAESNDTAPEALALSAHDRSIVVEDGDAVGREIRSLLTDAGRPEDEAVRVHREHVRFVRESGQFYVVALGKNPTRLNDISMDKGDREPVAPGDELELSDVVTLTVEAP